jgi:hypothetical protein
MNPIFHDYTPMLYEIFSMSFLSRNLLKNPPYLVIIFLSVWAWLTPAGG